MKGRRWQAPEVVQTSAMDCGPAALKCLLEGFRIPASYGRLREACQTDVDGTSIDTLEAVAPQLGVAAEQVLLPLDHVFLRRASGLPAIVVVRLADGAMHFVVVWRQCGDWLQVMDPASGRRWVRAAHFAQLVHSHEHAVPATDWRTWAASADFLLPLQARLQALGLPASAARDLVGQALADAGWFGCGALDACVRLLHSLARAGGVARGGPATRLLQALFDRCRAETDDIFGVVPQAYWSVTPDPASTEAGGLVLRLRGAVLLRVLGPSAAVPAGGHARSTELAVALREAPARPWRAVWQLVRQDGLPGPLALCGAMAIAAGGIVVETLLLRGVFDVGSQLALPGQRLAALAALLLFAALLLAFELPIVGESLRHGRHLELRLRMALLSKLPRLSDRYFQSRSVSDMADRAHSIQLARQMPSLVLNLVQTGAELALTLLGVALIAPAAAPWALAIAAAALLLPLAVQPLLAERDLRLRSHGSALHACTLDALLGAVPLRTHAAGPAVRRQHEALLVHWVQAGRGLIGIVLAAEGLQSMLCMGLAGGLLITHFLRSGAVTGGDLLLVYWALKLPTLAGSLAGQLRQFPAQRNVLLRLLELLSTPEVASTAAAAPAAGAMALRIEDGQVVAAGHEILGDIQLSIEAGEHVAIVGASGAGKSSLLGLFLGWHRLAQGRLLVDGQDQGSSAPSSLRGATAWVDPAVQLWNRPLLDNLLYASGDDGALARLGTVIEAADLRGVLQKLPHGLQSALGEGGALLSGGEGQRVRLGRALLQSGVRLALLDEPCRGLDRAQRAQLLRNARAWWRAATLLCVTHDVAETLDFDRVLVIDAGRIVEDGTPAALAAGDTRYAALLQAESQVRQGMWRGARWRKVRVEGGRVVADNGDGA